MPDSRIAKPLNPDRAVPYTFSVPLSLVERARAKSRETGVPMSFWVRKGLERGVEDAAT